MRLDHSPCAKEPNRKYFGPRKKKLDAVARVDEAIKKALCELETHPDRCTAFLQLLAHVRRQTDLLKPTSGQGSVGWSAPVFLVKRLKNLASRRALWIRAAEDWSARGGNLREEFRSLALHLLALYSVPAFMDSVWDLCAGPEAFRQQVWFIRLARGAKLRSLNLPIALTRQMEHHARRAPAHYTVIQALRYGETRGLGGGHNLACEVAASRLGHDTANTTFWRSVLRFFVTNPLLAINHVSLVVNFIQTSKFAGEEVLTADGIETRAAPWPGFSMEGRTPNSLVRLVRAWDPDFESGTNSGFSWDHSGISPFRFVEKNPEKSALDWTILELLNSSALQAEGRAMRHCVGRYAEKCRRRESTIWSLRLRVNVNGEEKRITTIEVDPRCRTIVQLRGKWNRTPNRRAESIVRRWAKRARIRYIDEV